MAVSETAHTNSACSETTCNDFSSRFFQRVQCVSLPGWEAVGHALRNLRDIILKDSQSFLRGVISFITKLTSAKQRVLSFSYMITLNR